MTKNDLKKDAEDIESERTAKIRDLNDALRTAPDPIRALMLNGSSVITRALAAKGDGFIHRAVKAMRTFSDFNPDNDPRGEHDCAVMNLGDETIMWKIDYYAPDLEHASEAPWDPGQTRRVLTLMLASDY